MQAQKRILVIGNGFDLAHDLPTRYTDFLEGLKWFKDNCDTNGMFLAFNNQWKYGKELMNSLLIANENVIFYNLGVKNIWTDHFLSVYNQKEDEKKGWIDFEEEIMDILKRLDDSFEQYRKKSSEPSHARYSEYHKMITSRFDTGGPSVGYYEKNIFRNLFSTYRPIGDDFEENTFTLSEFLLEQLNNFARAFELYIYYFVNKTGNEEWLKKFFRFVGNEYNEAVALYRCIDENKESYVQSRPFREKLQGLAFNAQIVSSAPINCDFDAILCFNYTNTYERLYAYHLYADPSLPVIYSYIHGKAQDIKEKSNIIIGVNEFLQPPRKNSDFTFLKFKKFFQRIDKRTGSEYKDWINGNLCNVYFFGHSFGESDFDVLRDFLLSDNCSNTILYHDEKSKLEKIQQTIKIIGQDNLVQRAHGENPKIKFEHQDILKSSERSWIYSRILCNLLGERMREFM